MSFKDKLNQFGKENGIGQPSEYFKFSEGANKLRILSEPVPYFEKFKVGICYTNCGYSGSPKTLCYIYDYKDNKIKLMRLPYTLAEQLGELQSDEDWHYDGFPMPFDITINATNAGTKEVKYQIVPRPHSQFDVAKLDELANKTSCETIIEKMKEKQKQRVDSGEVIVSREQEQSLEEVAQQSGKELPEINYDEDEDEVETPEGDDL